MPRPTELPKLARIALDALGDLKGQDIKVLDVQPLTTVTDTMILCTGTSSRHVKALAQNVAEDAKKAGYRPMGVEGQDGGEWVLVDLGDVVVHVFQAQARAFYQLEKLWMVDDNEIDISAPPKQAGKPVKKTASKAPAKTATARKTAAKKAAVKKAAVKKTVAGKAAAKSAPRKAATKKAPAKKTAPRKVAKKSTKAAAGR